MSGGMVEASITKLADTSALKHEDVHDRRAPDQRCVPVFMSDRHGRERRATGHRVAKPVRGSDDGSPLVKGDVAPTEQKAVPSQKTPHRGAEC